MLHPSCGSCQFDHSLKHITVGVEWSSLRSASVEQQTYGFIKPIHTTLLLQGYCGTSAIHHGNGVLINGNAYLMMGSSGIGKSTSAALLHQAGYTILCDENVFTRQITDSFRAYGTPWVSDAKLCSNDSAPLKGIFFLKQATENKLVPLSAAKALPQLLLNSCVFRYAPNSLELHLTYCERLLEAMPMYDLHFTPDERFVDFIRNSSL